MTSRSRTPDGVVDRPRDAGVTLVEIIVTIVMFSLVTGVIAAAVVVIFRTEDGVVASTAEAQDTRQVVNFFPLDVGSGTFDTADYRAGVGGAEGDRGSGCDEAGNDNLLRIDVDDDERIAYRLVLPNSGAPNASARIDRYVCALVDDVWTEEVRVNIADSLDVPAAGGEPLHVAEVIAAEDTYRRVETVKIDYVQRGRTESFSAAPRPENPYAASGLCDSQPLAAASRVASFVIGDVTLDGTSVKSALYVGGTLTFSGGVEVAQAQPEDALLPVPPGLGLMTTAVDWVDSSGLLVVKPGYDVLITGEHFVIPGGEASPTEIIGSENPTSNPNEPTIVLQGSTQSSVDDTQLPLPISPGEAFYELTLCSERLAQLPGSCDTTCSFHSVLPPDYSGTSNASSTETYLDLTDESANVLNVEPQNLLDLQGDTIFVPANVVSEVAPLIINVASEAGATIEFIPPTIQGLGQSTVHVIWNFPSASNVVIRTPSNGTAVLSGTVFAPYASVTSYADIAGGVIARELFMYGRDLSDERSFTVADWIFWGD